MEQNKKDVITKAVLVHEFKSHLLSEIFISLLFLVIGGGPLIILAISFLKMDELSLPSLKIIYPLLVLLLIVAIASIFIKSLILYFKGFNICSITEATLVNTRLIGRRQRLFGFMFSSGKRWIIDPKVKCYEWSEAQYCRAYDIENVSKIGDEFYLLSIGKNVIMAFNKRFFRLSDGLLASLEKPEPLVLTPEKIKADCSVKFKKEITPIIFITVGLSLVLAAVISLMLLSPADNILIKIIILLPILLSLLICVSSFVSAHKKKAAILNENYTIVTDTLEQYKTKKSLLIKMFPYQFSEPVTMTFKTYGKYETKSRRSYNFSKLNGINNAGEFDNSQEGDTFYLVLHNNNQISMAYNSKFYKM